MKTLRNYTKNVIANSSVILSGTEWSRRIFVGALFAALCFFTACDDSSSGAGPEPVAEISSSSDGEHAISSSSVTDKETSSGGGLVSSSSVKSDSSSEQMNFSSVSGKNSSSSAVESSSSEFVLKYCDEGSLDTLYQENRTVYVHCDDGFWETDSIVYKPKEKVYPNMDSLFATEYSPIYSEFEDPRDHQVYRTTILIDRNGSDKTIEVFAQNLNYGEMIDTSVLVRDDNKVEKYCDLNDEWFCNNGWGGNMLGVRQWACLPNTILFFGKIL